MRKYVIADVHLLIGAVKEEEMFGLLHYIVDDAVSKKCDSLDILGDLLDNRTLLMFRIWPRVNAFFDYARSQGLRVRVMAGNHDFYGTDKRTLCNLRHTNIGDKVELIDTIQVDDAGVLWIPWMFPGESIPSSKKTVKGVFAHLPLNGFKMSGNYVEDNGIDVPDIGLPVYLGHFHTPQIIKNCRYLGSPIHHTWNDANQNKYAYIIDGDMKIEDTIQLNHLFTNFIKVHFNDLKELQLPPKSKVTVVDVPKGDEALIIKALTEKGATSVECIPKDDTLDALDLEMAAKKGLSVEEAVVEQITVHDMNRELNEFHNLLTKEL